MGLPVLAITSGAAGTTGAPAAGGRSCAPRTPHANSNNASFRMALKGHQIMALLFQTNPVSRCNIAGYMRRLLVNPRYDSGRSHPITQMRPLHKTLGDYSSNMPSKSVVLR